MSPCAGPIGCGIVDAAPSWTQLLDQEGFPWRRVNRQAQLPLPFSVIVVDRPLLASEAAWVRSYLASGGGVLGAARFLGEPLGIPVRRQRIRWLIDPRDDASPWVDLLDVETPCHVPREANLLQTDDGTAAVFAGPWGGGAAVLLPFDPRDLWQQGSARTRLFPSRYERAPYELVAAAGRADLLRLLHCALEYLHHARSLPYAWLWPFPDAAPSVLAFRLDTDRASCPRIDAFAKLSADLGLPFTWFVDTASHEGWLERFAAMPGQEIGVHCYRHRSFTAPEDYITDIHDARRRLNAVGLAAEAYAAPFGIWNPALGEALERLEVPYSSEFGIGYDTLPFYPEIPGRRYSTLQVPVHPISPGALRRVGYSPGKMERYYADLLMRKIARAQPLFLYDHPVHGYEELCRTVLAEALRAGARPTTLGDFARWWRRRAVVLHAQERASQSDGLSLCISTPEGESFVPLVPREGEDPAPQGQAPTRPRALFHAPEGIRSTREFDLRTTIGAAFQAMSRRRQR